MYVIDFTVKEKTVKEKKTSKEPFQEGSKLDGNLLSHTID